MPFNVQREAHSNSRKFKPDNNISDLNSDNLKTVQLDQQIPFEDSILGSDFPKTQYFTN